MIADDQSPAPGEYLTLLGRGWPAGDLLSATLLEPGGPGSPSALMDRVNVRADGAFEVQTRLPHTLFGPYDGASFYVIPGQYLLWLRSDAGPSAVLAVPVGAPKDGALIWGEIALGSRGNIVNDEGAEVAVAGAVDIGAGIGLIATGDTQSGPVDGFADVRFGTGTDARGRYVFLVPPGFYRLEAQTDFGGTTWGTILEIDVNQQDILRAPLILQPGS